MVTLWTQTFVASTMTLQDMIAWYHLSCIFNAQKRSRTWKIERTDQLDGFEDLSTEDQAKVQEAIDEAAKDTKPATKGKPKQQATLTAGGAVSVPAPAHAPKVKPQLGSGQCDTSFLAFQRLCDRIAADNSSLTKIAVVSSAFQAMKADVANVVVLIKLLLPGKGPQ
jgi:Poly(ADP-ribose) polymerase and DNA-Ligase Zn-finger region